MPDPVRVTAGRTGLDALGRFGPFFAIETQPVLDRVAPPWMPLAALVERPGLLDGRIAAVGQALRPPASRPAGRPAPAQVAVSVTQLGLAARLVAVGLAAAVDDIPVPGGSDLWFQDRLGGPYPLAATAAADPDRRTGWPGDLLTLVGPVTTATVTRHALSAQVAWGNVASALAGAAQMITRAEPGAGPRASELVHQALASPTLAGTGGYDVDGRFRRRSCCLIYRLDPDAAVCGDCVLAGRR